MKELVFRARCDLCEVESILSLDASGDTDLFMDIPLTVETQSVVLDLCNLHRSELMEAVNPYMKAGRAPEESGEPKSAKKTRKKRPDSVPRVSPTEGYSTDPFAPYTINPDGTFQCPNCPKSSPRLQGLGAHRRQHGYVSQR